ncbi:LOW QUALITY PROTEIN: ceramide kinase [Drosophila albomicans]|uniref:LOW QUALITY PROTEIN: ceramide kinase n=1 Tax=Drosophila albomicans TaxID=7291 RepID=A0A6P8XT09_DROAB|nr:LOW QUALITY PROTEIN: ceramide kinase [Drosophila albomicans]
MDKQTPYISFSLTTHFSIVLQTQSDPNMTQSTEFGKSAAVAVSAAAAAAAASASASSADCSTDVLLNNFQLKKKSYRVLLHGQRVVWERLQRPTKSAAHNETVKTPLPDDVPTTEQQLGSNASCSYGEHSHILHMDDIISVRRGDTKQASLQPPDLEEPPADAKPTAQFLTINYAERLSKSKVDCNRWQLRRITFYNADAYIVRQWELQLLARLASSPAGGQRVRRLLVFINPYGGRKAGSQTYERYVRPLFQLAGIDATCITTQRANQIRDILLTHDLSCYDAVCCVGGDGTVAEVINGLVFRRIRELQLDEQRPAYIPRPSLPVAVIPAGSTDTIVYSMHGTADVRTAAIHVLLGQRRGLDVCSVSNSRSLLRFCASVLSYGYLGDVAAESEQYRWMGTKRYEYSGVKAFLSNRGYDAELHLLEEPLEPETPQSPVSVCSEPPSVCYANCQRCSIASSLQEQRSSLFPTEEEHKEQHHHPKSLAPTASLNHELQLSASETALLRPRPSTLPLQQSTPAAYGSDLSLRSGEQWKIIRGNFFMICGANITCACARSPNGISRYSHLGDGCLDLILVRKTTLLNNLRFLLNTAGRGGDIRSLPFVEVYRTRKFNFRTLNAPQENYSIAGSRQPIAQSNSDGINSEYSSWNCDGEVVTDLDVTMSSHCQLIDVFMRGPHSYSKPRKLVVSSAPTTPASSSDNVYCCCKD